MINSQPEFSLSMKQTFNLTVNTHHTVKSQTSETRFVRKKPQCSKNHYEPPKNLNFPAKKLATQG